MDLCNQRAPLGRPSRRDALRFASSGFGLLALSGVAAGARRVTAALGDGTPGPHFAPRAKRVIFLCMGGAPSHVDTFDHKPELAGRNGATLSGVRRGAKLLASPFKFTPSGRSGLMISELFPELARHADKLCLLRGMHTEVPVHAAATTHMHTGSFQFVRPSMGSWSLYGLGTENENLPGFVTINPPTGGGGAQNYGSAFLPATYQGCGSASPAAGGTGSGRRRRRWRTSRTRVSPRSSSASSSTS